MIRPRNQRMATGLLVVLAAVGAARAGDEGVVRISDGARRPIVRAQSPDEPRGVQPATYQAPQAAPSQTQQALYQQAPGERPTFEQVGFDELWYASQGSSYSNCPDGSSASHMGCPGSGWLHDQSLAYHARNQALAAQFEADCYAQRQQHWNCLRCKFGYLFPTGCCGKGCPPIGCYSMVYPVNPYYFDNRDGQIYAAQGFGGPVSVPLAPNVRHAYNYGWGVPSSRLTPISNPIQGGVAR